jgi:hypothetical protein
MDNYIDNVMKDDRYVFAFKNEATATVADVPKSFEATLLNGGVYVEPTEGDIANCYSLFESEDTVDINYVLAHPSAIPQAMNLCQTRRDCTMRGGLPKGLMEQKTPEVALSNVLNFAKVTYSTSSYWGALTAQAFQIQDTFNNKTRWINCGGDMIGLRIRQNLSNHPWYSDAGVNWGMIAEPPVAIAQDWNKTAIQEIYGKNHMNIVINKTGYGYVKFSDVSYLSGTSALKDEGVVELLVYAWRAARTFLDQQLYAYNDEFTRNQVRSQLTTFFKGVQDGRGIRRKKDGSDGFEVKCDTGNNTEEVINNKQLIVDFGFLPNRSIAEAWFRVTVANNEIQLTNTFA